MSDSGQVSSPKQDVAGQPPVFALEASGVSVDFGGIHALTDVSVAIMPRQVVAVVGPNGAGKTTLLNALCGLIPMTGTIAIHGKVVQSVNARSLAQKGLARSFQHPQLIEDETALENVLCGAHLRSAVGLGGTFHRRRSQRDREALKRQARDLLRRAQLSSGELARPVSELPHGARKRIDIVRAFMREPSILIMDEPTSGMGASERGAVQDLVSWARQDGNLAVLLVEHHFDVVREMAERVVVLEAGGVLLAGELDEVFTSEIFLAASVGKKSESEHDQPNGPG
jgi:ABC-type branched-subunit amino acid transport system ATPase component